MTVELRPFGVRCNIQCHYCYQNPQRESGNVLRGYDIEKMKAGIEAESSPFALFGGEPLMMPHDDLEDLWRWGLERFGENSVQTNGVLIDSDHIRMFHDYKVSVGLSVDGPDELNDVRWAGSLDLTRKATAKSHAAIELLCREGITPSLIVTLHRENASCDRLPRLIEWFRAVDGLGIAQVRLHILESENDLIRERYALSNEENLRVFGCLYDVQAEFTNLRFDTFDEMRQLLRASDEKAACVWQSCDPYTTKAVRGIEGSGQKSNCGRTNKDGIDFVKAEEQGFERYIALYHTPQAENGCGDCRFFLACKGQCPGTAIDGDWRNRTEHCSVWFGLYERIESELAALGETPLSVHPDRRLIESVFLRIWAEGKTTNLQAVRSWLNEHPMVRDLPFPSREDFLCREFLRISWVSDRARDVWQPRLVRIQKAWKTIEWEAIRADLRSCALLYLSAEELASFSGQWNAAGLAHELLGSCRRPLHESALTGGTPLVEETKVYHVLVGKPESLSAFKEAEASGRSETMAQLLGQPDCCHAFFRRCWVDEVSDDPTWFWAGGEAYAFGSLRLVAQPELHFLWKVLGIRTVPHITCGPDCAPSARFAQNINELGCRLGFEAEMDWLKTIQSWPVQWSALHGIAELKTPILKAISRTDDTARRRAVEIEGAQLPDEAPRALNFPWRNGVIESQIPSPRVKEPVS